jgi:hypothetical protein
MNRKTIVASLAAALVLAGCGASHHSASDLASASTDTSTVHAAKAETLTTPTVRSHRKRSDTPTVTKTETPTTPALRSHRKRLQRPTVTKTKTKKSTTRTVPSHAKRSHAPTVTKTKTKTTPTLPTRPKRSHKHVVTKPTPKTRTTPTHTQTKTKTSTTDTQTATTRYTTVNSTTPVGSPDAVPPPVTGAAPVPTAATPTGPTSPSSCMNTAGLADVHEWESGSWEGTDSTQHLPVYIDGPFANHNAAVVDGDSLTPVEYVVAAGDYVVQTTLTNKSPDVLTTLAQCIEG